MASKSAREKRILRRAALRDRIAEWAAKHHGEALGEGVRCWLGPHPPHRDRVAQGVTFAVLAPRSGEIAAFDAYAQAGLLKGRLERELIREFTELRFGVFELIDVDPGERMVLEDVFAGEVRSIVERSGSQQLRRGDWIYAAVFPGVEGWELEGTVAPIFPNGRLSTVQGWIQAAGDADPNALTAEQTRAMARDVVMALRNGERPPCLLNFDREPIELIEAQLDVPWPEFATAAADWADVSVYDEYIVLVGRHEATLGGRLSLATLEAATGGGTAVHVNSRQRLASAILVCEQGLGREVVVVSETLSDAPRDPLGPELLMDGAEREVDEGEEPFEDNLVQRWLTTPIPGLGGQTPEEAAAAGRRPEVRAVMPVVGSGVRERLREGLGV